jgi:hypothetical protein
VDLRASAAGGHVAEVRVQPVAARVRLLLGNNFNLIAHLQLIGERHDTAANFGADAAMADVAVDMVGKVERRRPAGRSTTSPFGVKTYTRSSKTWLRTSSSISPESAISSCQAISLRSQAMRSS